jgi:integrase
MLLMLTSGPRVSEITRLTWADVTLDKPGARVLWHGKGRKERLSPLQQPAVTGLRQWHRENPAGPGSFVFTARGTTRKMSTDAAAERIKVHAAAAAATACPGIAAKNVTPHVLRHYPGCKGPKLDIAQVMPSRTRPRRKDKSGNDER